MWKYYIIEENKKTIGYTDVYKINNKHKRCAIGYGIAKKCWGKGYATKALKLTLNKIKKLNIHTVEGAAHPKNIASQKVMEKIDKKLKEEWVDTTKNFDFDKANDYDIFVNPTSKELSEFINIRFIVDKKNKKLYVFNIELLHENACKAIGIPYSMKQNYFGYGIIKKGKIVPSTTVMRLFRYDKNLSWLKKYFAIEE